MTKRTEGRKWRKRSNDEGRKGIRDERQKNNCRPGKDEGGNGRRDGRMRKNEGEETRSWLSVRNLYLRFSAIYNPVNYASFPVTQYNKSHVSRLLIGREQRTAILTSSLHRVIFCSLSPANTSLFLSFYVFLSVFFLFYSLIPSFFLWQSLSREHRNRRYGDHALPWVQ